MKPRNLYLSFLCVLLGVAMASGQSVTSVTDNHEPPITISLVTFYPGSEPFAVYGHTELRVQQGNNDWYFNYGVFDFESPGFLYRFVSGQTDYLCAALPEKYATVGMEGRKMVEQRLNLSQQQARTVRNLLYENALPGNNTYRYRYFSDNCATRPRDIVEQALADSLRYDPTQEQTLMWKTSYRQMVATYTANYAWEQFGIDLVLGSRIDAPITYRQRMFAPLELMQAFAQADVLRNGHYEPLVQTTTVKVDGSDQGTILPATPWPLHPLTVAMAVLLTALGISWRDYRRATTCRLFDTLLFALAGLLGLLLWYLLLISTHEATSPNWNALWLNPFHLLLAACSLFDRRGRLLRACHMANLAIMVIALCQWLIIAQTPHPAFFPLIGAMLLRSLCHLCIAHRQRQRTLTHQRQ